LRQRSNDRLREYYSFVQITMPPGPGALNSTTFRCTEYVGAHLGYAKYSREFLMLEGTLTERLLTTFEKNVYQDILRKTDLRLAKKIPPSTTANQVREVRADSPESTGQLNFDPPPRQPADWQRERLAEHQRQRRSGFASVKSEQLVWTRESSGVLVTEADNYWAQALPLEGLKIGYMVYEKDSGSTASYGDGYDHERQAIDAAENFIRARP
jgi:hypothetical protein